MSTSKSKNTAKDGIIKNSFKGFTFDSVSKISTSESRNSDKDVLAINSFKAFTFDSKSASKTSTSKFKHSDKDSINRNCSEGFTLDSKSMSKISTSKSGNTDENGLNSKSTFKVEFTGHNPDAKQNCLDKIISRELFEHDTDSGNIRKFIPNKEDIHSNNEETSDNLNSLVRPHRERKNENASKETHRIHSFNHKIKKLPRNLDDFVKHRNEKSDSEGAKSSEMDGRTEIISRGNKLPKNNDRASINDSESDDSESNIYDNLLVNDESKNDFGINNSDSTDSNGEGYFHNVITRRRSDSYLDMNRNLAFAQLQLLQKKSIVTRTDNYRDGNAKFSSRHFHKPTGKNSKLEGTFKSNVIENTNDSILKRSISFQRKMIASQDINASLQCSYCNCPPSTAKKIPMSLTTKKIHRKRVSFAMDEMRSIQIQLEENFIATLAYHVRSGVALFIKTSLNMVLTLHQGILEYFEKSNFDDLLEFLLTNSEAVNEYVVCFDYICQYAKESNDLQGIFLNRISSFTSYIHSCHDYSFHMKNKKEEVDRLLGKSIKELNNRSILWKIDQDKIQISKCGRLLIEGNLLRLQDESEDKVYVILMEEIMLITTMTDLNYITHIINEKICCVDSCSETYEVMVTVEAGIGDRKLHFRVQDEDSFEDWARQLKIMCDNNIKLLF